MNNQVNLRCRIESLAPFYSSATTVDVLRLDLLHPVVSGNKWYKLKEYLKEAKQLQKIILTYGGAFSNHIVATAAAAGWNGLKAVGIIRGEKPDSFSPTLRQALDFGMELFFISREQYKTKIIPAEVFESYNPEDLYVIPEGGYGVKGVEGAKGIMLENDTASYTHILTAVGTGTTLAGITVSAKKGQKIIGVSVLKNNYSLQQAIEHLLPANKQKQFDLFHDYHFGGYAKHSKELLAFMNEFYDKTHIPTDFVYTGKAFFAAFDLLNKGYFSVSDKMLLVHTGGLQGNRSLPKGTLIFS